MIALPPQSRIAKPAAKPAAKAKANAEREIKVTQPHAPWVASTPIVRGGIYTLEQIIAWSQLGEQTIRNKFLKTGIWQSMNPAKGVYFITGDTIWDSMEQPPKKRAAKK